MQNIFSLIGQSWMFLREQKTLGPVAILYIFLPTFLANLLPVPSPSDAMEMKVIVVLAHVTLGLLVSFGIVCVLHIGKRMLQAKSGRKKTSLKAVQKQAWPSFLPFLLTGLLRGIFIFFWIIPIIIVASTLFPFAEGANALRKIAYVFLVLTSALPAIRYVIGTSFYGILSVCENISYRDALRQSKKIVHKAFFPTAGTIALLTALIGLPAQLFGSIILQLTQKTGITGMAVGSIAASFLMTVSILIYLPALILLFQHLHPHTDGNPVNGVIR